jgi:hypothetical protein
VLMEEEDYLQHYGILRKSGRYPWGSGDNVSQRSQTFLDTVDSLRSQGLSDTEICRGFSTIEHPYTTSDLRASRTIALAQLKHDKMAQAEKLAATGMSNGAIAKEMGLPNESSVRSLLASGKKDKADSLENTRDMLRREVDKKGAIDIGAGNELSLPLGDNPAALIGVTETKFKVAVAMLREEGYVTHKVKVPQVGTGKETTIKVLAKPDVKWVDLKNDPGLIKLINEKSQDNGKTWPPQWQTPIAISSKRVGINYKEDGGAEADGVIYVRPGAKDLSLGANRYAQVRIDVEGTHYIKGMAILKDDLPHGVDLVFNTNKSNTGNKLDALKPQEADKDNPFGAITRQLHDEHGKVHSAMNIVNDEGKWETWSRSLPSQMLSKQEPSIAKQQLDVTYERRRKEFEEIMALTNPTVKKKLLEEFAEGTDSAAVHLKAAAMQRQATQVILPVKSVKDNEIYAPNFNDGERVALVRFPHGGTFEIPQLTVNNRNREAKSLLGNGKDAVGINSRVAERLSGADFDGDTVLVIPNPHGSIKSSPPLDGLKNFDPKSEYRAYPGMKTVDGGIVQSDGKTVDYGKNKPRPGNMQQEMGNISNLITDMTLKGANHDELARAVRHSMVVIDCEKHKLDYKASAVNNGILALKEKYQGAKNAGASTIVSRSTAETRVNLRKPRAAADGGPIDRKTGALVFVETGEQYTNKKGKVITKTFVSKQLAETPDAHTLLSADGGTRMERIYADHSNKLKSLANQARLQTLDLKGKPYSDSAKRTYSKEVDELNSALKLAKLNAPLERQAQALARSVINQKKAANPDMDKDDLKKVSNQALAEMRKRTGAGKTRIELTPTQWQAIQAGAISKTKLEEILNHADMDSVRVLATPRERLLMSSSKLARAQRMIQQGFTQAEIAAGLGVSLTTLKNGLNG